MCLVVEQLDKVIKPLGFRAYPSDDSRHKITVGPLLNGRIGHTFYVTVRTFPKAIFFPKKVMFKTLNHFFSSQIKRLRDRRVRKHRLTGEEFVDLAEALKTFAVDTLVEIHGGKYVF